MKITVNGTPREAAANLALADLLNDYKLNPKTTLVELNREVLDRSVYDTTQLQDGDTVELVRFVGGG
ncbi:sulfur carrier protein ThiS [bacterium]|nr:sulfur carrier protein ThiS [bacterium]MBU1651932.1 sulfur carrier protein ThiS [bacterium]MBU1881421.1 sulfur carrier protein ThiS [bacterium]